ncbi:hypothetical protein [Spirobacillus cienkowskii]|uniref:hypothetical protein n=1 Tax=Spirobacillus cienkowskii TaxID=495820 RepID=UPI0030D2B48D
MLEYETLLLKKQIEEKIFALRKKSNKFNDLYNFINTNPQKITILQSDNISFDCYSNKILYDKNLTLFYYTDQFINKQFFGSNNVVNKVCVEMRPELSLVHEIAHAAQYLSNKDKYLKMIEWSASPVRKLSSRLEKSRVDIKNILITKLREDEIKIFDNINTDSVLKKFVKSWPQDAKNIFINTQISRKEAYHEGYHSTFKLEEKTSKFSGTTKNIKFDRIPLKYGNFHISNCGCFDRAIEYDNLEFYEWPIFEELNIPKRPYYLSLQATKSDADAVYQFIRKKTTRQIFKRWILSFKK